MSKYRGFLAPMVITARVLRETSAFLVAQLAASIATASGLVRDSRQLRATARASRRSPTGPGAASRAAGADLRSRR